MCSHHYSEIKAMFAKLFFISFNFNFNLYKNKYMKLLIKLLLIVFYIHSFSDNLFSQPKQDIIFKQDFIPLLDSLLPPPSSCEEAYKLMMFDSVNNEYVYVSVLEDQNNRIQTLSDELTSSVNQINQQRNSLPQRPEGNGPPPGGYPPEGIGDIQNEPGEIKYDMDEVYRVMDKMNIAGEEFKDELTLLQSKVNEKLHKTLESDQEAHITIANEFLKSGSDLYKKYCRTYRLNLLKIDEVIKKYDYGSKIKMPRIKSEILNLQMAQITNLKLLVKVTRELVKIGCKFYR